MLLQLSYNTQQLKVPTEQKLQKKACPAVQLSLSTIPPYSQWTDVPWFKVVPIQQQSTFVIIHTKNNSFSTSGCHQTDIFFQGWFHTQHQSIDWTFFLIQMNRKVYPNFWLVLYATMARLQKLYRNIQVDKRVSVCERKKQNKPPTSHILSSLVYYIPCTASNPSYRSLTLKAWHPISI